MKNKIFTIFLTSGLLQLSACNGNSTDQNQASPYLEQANQSQSSPVPTIQGDPSVKRNVGFVGQTIDDGESGGGPSVVCRNADHSVQSARLLDTYEGTVIDGLSISESSAPINDQIQVAAKTLLDLNLFLEYDLEDETAYLQKNSILLPGGSVIQNPVTDLGVDSLMPIPDGCQIEYAGSYSPSGNLLISQSIYEKLTARDQAAFFVHEALYKIARSRSYAKDSYSTRNLTAHLFANNVAADSLKSLISDFVWGPTASPLLLGDISSVAHLELRDFAGGAQWNYGDGPGSDSPGFFYHFSSPIKFYCGAGANIQYGFNSEFNAVDAPQTFELPLANCEVLFAGYAEVGLGCAPVGGYDCPPDSPDPTAHFEVAVGSTILQESDHRGGGIWPIYFKRK